MKDSIFFFLIIFSMRVSTSQWNSSWNHWHSCLLSPAVACVLMGLLFFFKYCFCLGANIPISMTSAMKYMHLFCKVPLFPGSVGFYLQAVQALVGLPLSGLHDVLHRALQLLPSSWHCLGLCAHHRVCSFSQPHRLHSFSGLQCWVLSAAALTAAMP